MMTKEEFIHEQEKLDKEIQKIWQNPVLDGVTDYEKYIKAPVKILWILKEPNDGNQGNSWNHREFHKNVEGTATWRATYANIIRISYGVIEEKYQYELIPKIEKDSSFDFDIYILEEIAIINVNKIGAGAVSDGAKLNQIYQKNDVRKLLAKQITFINPDIIINAHHVSDFIRDQSGQKPLINSNGCKYLKADTRFIIDANHPNQRQVTDKVYCDSILQTIFKYYV